MHARSLRPRVRTWVFGMTHAREKFNLPNGKSGCEIAPSLSMLPLFQSRVGHMRFSFGAFSGFLLLVSSGMFFSASAQGIFLTPVPNAPFTAVVEVQRTEIRPDGSVVDLKSIRDMARDGQGRIHNESRSFVPANSTKTPEIEHIHLYDPQTRISTEIDVRHRTCYTHTLDHPPSTVPPTVRYGSPSDTGIPQNDFSKEENLGSQEIEGVMARGVRETQIIPAESSQTGKEVIVTDEYWYSDELRINVLMKHSDPRTGTKTLKVTGMTRGEPDPAEFQIPEGYSRMER